MIISGCLGLRAPSCVLGHSKFQTDFHQQQCKMLVGVEDNGGFGGVSKPIFGTNICLVQRRHAHVAAACEAHTARASSLRMLKANFV